MSASSNTRSSFGRIVAWLATPAGLVAMFGVGLAIRLLLARADGFPYDMEAFAAWAERLADGGPWDFYPTGGEEFSVDYPPGYLYVLWPLGALAKGPPTELFLKLPPIFADLALAALVIVAAERLGPLRTSKGLPVRSIAAASILLNPAIFFVSAVWGQVDSVSAVLVVGALLLLGTGVPSLGREASGIALLALAFGTKPQIGFVLPVVVLVLVWRHVYRRQSDARIGALRVVALGIVGVASGSLLFAPFQLYPKRAFDFYAHSAGTYKVTSVYAFNMWGATGFWKPDSGEGAVRFLGVPALFWGLVLFIATGTVVMLLAWKALRKGHDEGRVMVFGSMAMALVGFAVLTRIHERYVFLPLVLGAVLIGTWWMRRAFLVLSAAFFVNVFFPYVYYLRYEGRSAPTLWGFYDLFYGTAERGIGVDVFELRLKILSGAIAALCLVVAWRGWRDLDAHSPSLATHEP